MTKQVFKSVDQDVTLDSDELHFINDALVHYINALLYMPLSIRKDSVFKEKFNSVCDLNNKIADLLIK